MSVGSILLINNVQIPFLLSLVEDWRSQPYDQNEGLIELDFHNDTSQRDDHALTTRI